MTNGHTPLAGEKQTYDPEALRRSVIETEETQPGSPTSTGLVYMVAGYADEIRPWGTNPTMRDRQLRDFIPMESYVASALATVCARNMAFSWRLDGPPTAVARMQDMLLSSDQGRGWESLIAKHSMDLYSQDKIPVFELVREEDSERAPVIGLNHLDTARIWHTRNPEYPVLYLNDKGRWVPLKWYQVVSTGEMPAPHERLAGLQYSALTRVMRMAQIFRNIAIYYDEKTGGRSTKSLHILGNVKEQAIRDAMMRKQLMADSQGYQRAGMDWVLVETFDPQAVPSVVSLDFASIPDGFDLDNMNKWYLTAIAMGLLEDYQTFAPLPGGGLGTSNQSQILRAKARGKGPGLFMKLMVHAMNFRGIMPRNVTFAWDEQDLDADEMMADLAIKRAEMRAAMIANGEIDDAGARQMALDSGDLPVELFDLMNGRDLTRPPATDAKRTVDDQEDAPGQKARFTIPASSGVDEERKALEEEIAAKLGEGFKRVERKLARRLRGEEAEKSRSIFSFDLSGLEDAVYASQVESAGVVKKGLEAVAGGIVQLQNEQHKATDETQFVMAEALQTVAAAVEQQTDRLEAVQRDTARSVKDAMPRPEPVRELVETTVLERDKQGRVLRMRETYDVNGKKVHEDKAVERDANGGFVRWRKDRS